MSKEFVEESNRLLEFIRQSPTSFHAIDNVAKMLEANGFKELCLKKSWTIEPHGRYYTRRNGSALVAFVVDENAASSGLRIIATHSDSPSFRIKPQPEMIVDNKFLKLNIEAYGGAILHTWFDRPLSIAGRVALRGETPMNPRKMLFDFNRPIGVIPSLAIHLNRSVNDDLSINVQSDMPVVVNMYDGATLTEDLLKKEIAKLLNVQCSDILDFDAFLYNIEPGTIIGFDDSMVLSSRLDNLALTYASACAMCDSNNSSLNKVLCIFDNEEVGSCTKQGAKSPFLKNVIERVSEKMNFSVEQYQTMLYNSFVISADSAHSVHPNKVQMYDPLVHPTINGGMVIKIAANQSYMTDADGSSVMRELCDSAKVPYQLFVNRSDKKGGSTIGNILTSQMDIRGVDVGTALLAMHSVCELAGIKDQLYARNVFTYFFSK